MTPGKKMKNSDALCAGCPLRKIGLRYMRDIANGYGGLTVEQLAEGDTLPTRPIRNSYAFLRSGVLKLDAISTDGNTSVIGFLFTGEPIPFSHVEAPVIGTALVPSTICRLSAPAILSRKEGAGHILDTYWSAALSQAIADQQRLASSRQGEAAERLHWFLTDISERTASRDISLCMSRADIGAYLGLRPESVSRAFKTLEQRGRIIRKGVRDLTMS